MVTFAARTVIDPVTSRFWIVWPALDAVIDPDGVRAEHDEVVPTFR